MPAATYDDLLALAVEVAHEAAELVRRRRREGVEVAATKSSPVDIVTEVDRASERLIFERLTGSRPGDGFLGEEGASAESTSGVVWIVDPIDGTVNFLYGIPHYSVSIAAAVDDEVVAGVVLNVRQRRAVHRDPRRGVVPGRRPSPGRRAGLVGPAVPAAGRHRLQLRRRGEGRSRRWRSPRCSTRSATSGGIGSAALDLCSVGCGRMDAFVEEGLNVWDMAAGGLVATEAGARLEQHPGVGGNDVLPVRSGGRVRRSSGTSSSAAASSPGSPPPDPGIPASRSPLSPLRGPDRPRRRDRQM